ncbi:O-methyltransferase domain - like 1 [Theobroma cacao]|nr:O-methyltransferase domain - like 1 [Theobroma cacao]
MEDSEQALENFTQAMRLASASALPMAMQAAIDLGVFDMLAPLCSGLRSVDIGARLGCRDPESLEMLDRLIGVLCCNNVLACSEGCYILTPAAKYFAKNEDGVSLAPLLRLNHDRVLKAVKDAILEGGNPFSRAHGMHVFEYLGKDGRFNQVYSTAMFNHTTVIVKKMLKTFKGFKNVKTLVDVGGGIGGILRDWSDAQCLKLLKNCYNALPKDGKVIVIEQILPTVADLDSVYKGKLLNDVLTMTLNPGGKERKQGEMFRLAEESGFDRIQFSSSQCHYHVLEFIKSPNKRVYSVPPKNKIRYLPAFFQVVASRNEATNEELQTFTEVMHLVSALALPRPMQAAMDLGISDILAQAGRGLSSLAIASRLGIREPNSLKMLDRLVTLLACHDVFTCSEDCYSLTPAANYFARNEDGVFLAPLMRLNNDRVFLESWSGVKDAILEGGNPFNRAHGTNHVFEYLGKDGRFSQVYNTAMFNRTTIVNIKTLIDVGGGIGVALNVIISKYPSIKGVNFDLPYVIQNAPPFPDMFESIPKGDAIFMKGILRDWGDDQWLKLLKNCYNALPKNGKVMVVEQLLPIYSDLAYSMQEKHLNDVLALTLTPGGKERNQYGILLLRIESWIP